MTKLVRDQVPDRAGCFSRRSETHEEDMTAEALIPAADLIRDRRPPDWLKQDGGIRWPSTRVKPLSVSRMRTYMQCPGSYALRYLYRYEPRCGMYVGNGELCLEPVSTSGNGTKCHAGHADPPVVAPVERGSLDKTAWDEHIEEPSTCGTIVHDVVDATLSRAVDTRSARLDIAWAEKRYEELFIAHDLRGQETYSDGLEMLRNHLEKNRDIDLSNIVASEMPFTITLDGYAIQGYIDLVERISDDKFRVTDYKTNRLLFSEDELRVDIQLGVYSHVVRQIFGVKEVELRFEMLRHGFAQTTSRSSEQAEDAVRYLIMLARAAEDRKDFPEVLNKNCPWCEHQRRCRAFQRATTIESPDDIIGALAKNDVQALAKQREVLSGMEKIASRRIGQIDKIFAAKIEEEGPFEANNRRYELQSPGYKDFEIGRVLRIIRKHGIEPDLSQFAVVFKKKLDTYIASVDMPRSHKQLMKTQLEGAGAPSQRELEVKALPLRK